MIELNRLICLIFLEVMMLKNARQFIVYFLSGITLIALLFFGQSRQQVQSQEPTETPNHASYVDNFNEALQQAPNLQNQSVEALLSDLDSVPEEIRTTVRNNGGGHLNHTIFWQLMSPDGGGEPTGEIAQEINETFGSFSAFQEQFNKAGSDRFGSGWVWLVRNPEGQLEIMSMPNQDNPIMEGNYPIMGNDVWEHAYYLRYQNRRADYLTSWWDVVNWNEVNRRSQASLQQQS
jgi:Fe-Mn family superoxide dismutase